MSLDDPTTRRLEATLRSLSSRLEVLEGGKCPYSVGDFVMAKYGVAVVVSLPQPSRLLGCSYLLDERVGCEHPMDLRKASPREIYSAYQARGLAKDGAGFRVGDLIVGTDHLSAPLRKMMVVLETTPTPGVVTADTRLYSLGAYHHSFFRPATDPEIRAYLGVAPAEPVAEEIKVGDWIWHSTRCKPVQITKVEYDGAESPLLSYQGGQARAKHIRRATAAEMASYLEDEARRVVVRVDDKDYEAVFRAGYVEFGCARIWNLDLRDGYSWVNRERLMVLGEVNRQREGILLGKGVFTREILAKMMPQLRD